MITTVTGAGTSASENQARRYAFPLSPGERARVRASVPLTFRFPNSPCPRVSRQRMRRAFLQRVENNIPHILFLSSQLPVPEAQFSDAHRSEIFCSFGIMSLLFGKTVLPAIQFNREAGYVTVEIEEVFSDREIPSKLVGTEPPVAQPTPHQLLSPSRLLPQSASAFSVGHSRRLGWCGRFEKNGFTTALTPALSPRRGRIVSQHSSYRTIQDYLTASLLSSKAKTGGVA